MSFKSLKIGKYTIEKPIVQGAMGENNSLDVLAGNVSLNGGLGTISSVGTGYTKNGKYLTATTTVKGKALPGTFNSSIALSEIVKSAKNISNGKPVAVNVMVALTDYKNVLFSACEAGADIIVSGAGLPIALPEIKEKYPNIAMVPIIANVKVLRILLKRWSRLYGNNMLPDALIVEGPKSGGHQGHRTIEACKLSENQLEAVIPPIISYLRENELNIPVIAAGGIWDSNDIKKFINMGCSAVQIGTRFLATNECEASDTHKKILLEAKKEDIVYGKSPVGFICNRLNTKLFKKIADKTAPAIKCISNCVTGCEKGKNAVIVGYCIADRLNSAFEGDEELGLFFSGTNGYRCNEIIPVKNLINKLM